MRITRCHVGVELGDETAVVDVGSRHATVRFDNAMVTFHGTAVQRRALLHALAAHEGMRVVPTTPDSARIEVP